MTTQTTLPPNLTDDSRAWRRADIETTRPWQIHLPGICQDIINNIAPKASAITDIQLNDSSRAAGREALADALHHLESGCGFAVLNRLPIENMSTEQATLAYWLIGQMFGDPFVQNVRGSLLYDVRDTGGDYTKGARFSVTSDRTSFHTDGAFNPRIPDYVSLLCLKTAATGGENQLISAFTLHNALTQHAAKLTQTLYEPFYFDRRGEFVEGESPTTQTSIFDWDGSELTMRYLNYYIHEGHRIANRDLTDSQLKAMDGIEHLLANEDLFVQFSLEPGQILIANNHWTLHNRNAFVDHQDPAKRRHYVRLWSSRCY